MARFWTFGFVGLVLAGCTSVGQVGLMARPGADVGAMVREARAYEELGAVEGEACRYFALGIIPWGDSSASTAMANALDKVGGDALINVSVETSLYGFIPIYNVFANTCTTVRGIAIRFQDGQGPAAGDAAPTS